MSGKAQLALFEARDQAGGTSRSGTSDSRLADGPPKTQLLKWVGNKQRFARDIVSFFPLSFNTYFEPFLGSGAVLATLAPRRAIASDSFKPLMEIWTTLKDQPQTLIHWYGDRYRQFMSGDRAQEYERIKATYNKKPNGADLIFLCRACYGGVVRFRQADGYMSTPCGVHNPISPQKFAQRAMEWRERISGTEFFNIEFEQAMIRAKAGDLIYCDPPYSHTQSILYGAQSFSLKHLLEVIDDCKRRGVYVALSIDGSKKSGNFICELPIPEGLFTKEILVDCGRSMLKRFQMKRKTLEKEIVADRLFLTY